MRSVESIRIHYLSAECVGLSPVTSADLLSRISVMYVENRNVVFAESFFHLVPATSVELWCAKIMVSVRMRQPLALIARRTEHDYRECYNRNGRH